MPTSPRDRTSPPQIRTKQTKKPQKAPKHTERKQGYLRSRPIKATKHKETTQDKIARAVDQLRTPGIRRPQKHKMGQPAQWTNKGHCEETTQHYKKQQQLGEPNTLARVPKKPSNHRKDRHLLGTWLPMLWRCSTWMPKSRDRHSINNNTHFTNIPSLFTVPSRPAPSGNQ